MKKSKQRLEVSFQMEQLEKINSQFSKVKILVMYSGLNRNNSYMSKETIEKAVANSIYHIPVVGEYLEDAKNDVDEDGGNFGDHGGKIELSSKGIKFIQTTKPYGVVGLDANPRWEKVNDRYSGEEREYLVVDCYLWTGRYPEAEIVVNNGSYQSMEIEPTDADWVLHEDDDGLYHDVYKINEFEFSALCILGKSEDPKYNVEPCFEDAQIIAYQFNKQEFKDEYSEMLNQLKHTLNSENDGGNSMEIKKTDEFEPEVTEEVIEVTEEVIEHSITETIEEPVTEETTFEESEVEETVDETVVEVEETEETVDEVYSAEEYNALLGKIAVLEAEITDLKEFKSTKLKIEKENEINELLEKFTKVLDEDEISEIKANAYELELAELETALYALVGKKKANFTKTKDTRVVMPVTKIDEEEAEVYGSANKYFQK